MAGRHLPPEARIQNPLLPTGEGARVIQFLDVVLPVFGLIAIGYAARRLGILSAAAGEGISEFVFTFAISVLLFRTVATADLGGVSPWRIWAAYYGGIAVVWLVAHAVMRRAFGRDARGAVVGGVSAAFANTVLIGLPFVQQIYDDSGVVVALVIISIHTPVIMVSALLMHDWALRTDGIAEEAAGPGRALLHLAAELVRNPVIVGILAGVLWRGLGLPLAGPVGEIVDALARTAGPLALVASGIGLARYGLRGRFGQASAMAGLKLLLLPGVVLALGMALGLPPLAIEVTTLVAACPTGVNAFILASRFRTGEALASTVMTLSTAFALVTMIGWLAVLRAVLG